MADTYVDADNDTGMTPVNPYEEFLKPDGMSNAPAAPALVKGPTNPLLDGTVFSEPMPQGPLGAPKAPAVKASTPPPRGYFMLPFDAGPGLGGTMPLPDEEKMREAADWMHQRDQWDRMTATLDAIARESFEAPQYDHHKPSPSEPPTPSNQRPENPYLEFLPPEERAAMEPSADTGMKGFSLGAVQRGAGQGMRLLGSGMQHRVREDLVEFIDRNRPEAGTKMPWDVVRLWHDGLGMAARLLLSKDIKEIGEKWEEGAGPRTAPSFFDIRGVFDALDWAATGTGEAIGTSLPILAGSLVGGPAGALAISLRMGVGQARQEFEDEQKVLRGRAEIAARLGNWEMHEKIQAAVAAMDPDLPSNANIIERTGLIIGALDSVQPLAMILKDLPFQVSTNLKKQMYRAALGVVMNRTRNGMLQEGTTEMAQAAMQIYGIVKGAQNAGQATEVLQTLWERRYRLIEEGLTGAMAGGVLAGAGSLQEIAAGPMLIDPGTAAGKGPFSDASGMVRVAAKGGTMTDASPSPIPGVAPAPGTPQAPEVIQATPPAPIAAEEPVDVEQGVELWKQANPALAAPAPEATPETAASPAEIAAAIAEQGALALDTPAEIAAALASGVVTPEQAAQAQTALASQNITPDAVAAAQAADQTAKQQSIQQFAPVPSSPDPAAMAALVANGGSPSSFKPGALPAAATAAAAADGTASQQGISAAQVANPAAVASALATTGLTPEVLAQVLSTTAAGQAPTPAAQAAAQAALATAQTQAVASPELVAQLQKLGIDKATSEAEVRQILTTRAQNAVAAQNVETRALAGLGSHLATGGSLDMSPETVAAIAKASGINPEALPNLLASAQRAGMIRRDADGSWLRDVPQPTMGDVQAALDEAMRAVAPLLPKGTKARAFSTVADLPASMRAAYEDRDGKIVRKSDGGTLEAFKIPKLSEVYVASYAIDRATEKITHEGWHALVEAGLVKAEEIKILADRARKTGIFDERTEAGYTKDYQTRFPKDWQARVEEEAAAHLLEARAGGTDTGRRTNSILDRVLAFLDRLANALRARGFQNGNDVEDAFLSGEMARRETVGTWMSSTGVSSMAVKDGAVLSIISEGALTFDQTRRKRAEEMEADGRRREAIWRETQTYRGPDGFWRQEIADFSKMVKTVGRKLAFGQLEDFLSHDALYAAYPHLPGIRTLLKNSREEGGRYTGDDIHVQGTVKRQPIIMLHEVQHAIQHKDGLARGGNPGMFLNSPIARSMLEDIVRGMPPAKSQPDFERLFVAATNLVLPGARTQSINDVVQIFDDVINGGKELSRPTHQVSKEIWRQAAWAYYRHLAGEAEARMVEQRINYTPEQRLVNAPFQDYDVYEANLIVRGVQPAQLEMPFSATDLSMLSIHPKVAQADKSTGQRMKRKLDAMGFYSKLDEVLGEFNPKDRITAETLQKRGVKAVEIELRGIKDLLASGAAVPAADLLATAQANPVQLIESKYAGSEDENDGYRILTQLTQRDEDGIFFKEIELFGYPYTLFWDKDAGNAWVETGDGEILPATGVTNNQDIENAFWAAKQHARDLNTTADAKGPAQFKGYSLDPDNEAYAETVISLPSNEAERRRLREELRDKYGDDFERRATPEEMNAAWPTGADFTDGHFPEPNTVAHTMASLVSYLGRTTYVLDQVQSDWGQLLRDNGIADPDKIARLQLQSVEAREAEVAARDRFNSLPDGPERDASRDALRFAKVERTRIEAELRGAMSAPPGHPMVNTTDQWTTLILKRAIRQAVEANARYIAIPTGDTVLSYNPGDTNGMREFYGSIGGAAQLARDRAAGRALSPSYVADLEANTPQPGIVPKNLRKLLSAMDKEAGKPVLVEQLHTPHGMKGKGFTLFPLTDVVRTIVMESGQPMFSVAFEKDIDNEIERIRTKGQLGTTGGNPLARGGQDVARGIRRTVGRDAQGLDPALASPEAGAGGNRRRNYQIPGTFALTVAGGPAVDGSPQRFWFLMDEGQTAPRADSSDPAALEKAQATPSLARAHLIQDLAGRWQLANIEVDAGRRGEGLANALIDGIEADIGQQLAPPARLTSDGYGLFSSRDPEGLLDHIQVGNDWIHPSRLNEIRQTWEDIASALPAEAKAATATARALAELQRDVDPAAYTDESMMSVTFTDPGLLADGDHVDRIATRYPRLVSSTENPLTEKLVIGIEAMKQNPEAFEHNAGLIRRYVNFPSFDTRVRNADKVVAVMHEQMVGNLIWLHDQVKPEIREQSKRWYDGARILTEQWSQTYGVPPRSVAGVLAALSPQKDWYQNVSLAERVLDIWTKAQDRPFSNQMMETAQEIFGKEQYAEALTIVSRAKLSDLNDQDQLAAMWIRIFDQTYNERSYRHINTEGQFIGTPKGKVAWGSLTEVAKAVRSLRDPRYATISQAMGVKHKVRNFYNNILAPKAPWGDVTIDTHAVAAALLRVLSGNTVEVAHNFGNNLPVGKQPADWQAAKLAGISGAAGTYGIYADAYREAARRLGILPRELQSITWEAVRGLFPAKWKQKTNVELINEVWLGYKEGRLTLDETRSQILDLAGGIADPSWYRPAGRAAAEIGQTSYQGELSGVRVPRRPARGVGRGAGGDAAGAVPTARRGKSTAGEMTSVVMPPPPSLHKLSTDLARDLGITLRAGMKTFNAKLAKRAGLRAIYDPSTGVIRARSMADFNAIAQNVGAAIQHRIGPDFDAIVLKHADELVPMGMRDLVKGVRQPPDALTTHIAFSLWFSTFMTNPGVAKAQAPGFYNDMKRLLDVRAPATLKRLQETQAGIVALAQADPISLTMAGIRDATRAGRWENFKADRELFGLRGALAARLSTWYTQGADATNPIYLAVRNALEIQHRNTGKRMDLKDLHDPYVSARMAPHANAWAAADLERGVRNYITNEAEGHSFIDALVTALGKDKARAVDMSEGSIYRRFSNYLVNKYLVDEWTRFQRGEKERPPTRPPYGTNTTAEVIAYYQKAAAQEEAANPQFIKGAQQLYDFQAKQWKLWLDSGHITPEKYKEHVADTHYVPLYRHFDDNESIATTNRATGTGPQGVLKKKVGSDRDIVDPLAGIAQKMFEMRTTIARNDISRNVIQLAEAAGPGGGVIAERLDPIRMKAMEIDLAAQMKKVLGEAEVDPRDEALILAGMQQVMGDSTNVTIFTREFINPGKLPIVFFFEGGKPQAMQLGDGEHGLQLAAKMHEVLNTFGKEPLNWAVTLAALPAQAQRMGIISHPDYGASNIVRDAVMAFIWDPRAWPFITQWRGLWEVVRKGPKYQRYVANAGMVGGEGTAYVQSFREDRSMDAIVRHGYNAKLGYQILTMPTFDHLTDYLKDLANPKYIPDRMVGATMASITGALLTGGTGGLLIGAAAGALAGGRALVKLSEISETATRTMLYDLEYQHQLKSGLTPAEAARAAAIWSHDYTDYSRRGSKMDVAARIIPFSNSNVQGNDTYLRRMFGKSKHGWLAPLGPFSYLAYRLGLTETKWNELTPRERRELGLSAHAWAMSVLGLGSITMAVSALFGDDERIREVDDRIKAANWLMMFGDKQVRIMKPFQTVWFAQAVERYMMERGSGKAMEHYLDDLWQTWSPPFVPPIFQVGATAMGADLRNMRMVIPPWAPLLNKDQVNASTSPFAIWFNKNVYGMSPLMVDHIVKTYGATWGNSALKINVPGLPWYDPTKPEQTAEDQLILRRFLWREGAGSEAGQGLRDMMGAESPLPAIGMSLFERTNKYAAQADGLNRLTDDVVKRPAEVMAMLERMSPKERAFSILQVTMEKDNTKYRMLHPLNRAREIAKVVQDVGGQLNTKGLILDKGTKTPKLVPMSPNEKMRARQLLLQIEYMEGHNAQVLTEEAGYRNRKIFDIAPIYAQLAVASPDTAKELARRYKKEHIVSDAGIRKAWPEMEKRLFDPQRMIEIRKGIKPSGLGLYGIVWAKAQVTPDRVVPSEVAPQIPYKKQSALQDRINLADATTNMGDQTLEAVYTPPPAPEPKPPRLSVAGIVQRDATGKAAKADGVVFEKDAQGRVVGATKGGKTFRVERDDEGRVTRLAGDTSYRVERDDEGRANRLTAMR